MVLRINIYNTGLKPGIIQPYKLIKFSQNINPNPSKKIFKIEINAF